MNPVTHLLGSWALAENLAANSRDRSLITWLGVIPDLDALGAGLDKVQSLLGNPPTWHYGDYHHLLLHGLPAAVVLPAVFAFAGANRLRVALGGFLAIHLHLFCDFVGSRGPDPTDIWPIWYLAPMSDRPVLYWSHQWPVNAWPNIAITVLLLAYQFWTAVVRGRTVVGIFSKRADVVLVQTLRVRWASLTHEIGREV